ncbi:ATP-binding protein [Polaromonas sp. JS666]|uniref:sensor histidine kinase n=1 Tax=Polaromonas sp. (strain JS666 / ATCC BAA-500) TaxID=296591 RepID=UPI000881025F|nr:ATP-binding protein [Polaromonas sp. JS666]SDO08887.1 Signal transduction histidine kinase involved in nitrogen fixation and metabolism regulation [Polaromonas sp. JS666]
MNLQVSGGSLKSSKAFRWTVGVGIGTIVALGLVLMFLLTQATGNRELYERNYALLLVLNIAVAGLLLLVIGWIIVRLLLRLRRGRFGSRLLVKLAAIFALVGLVPGLMIYVVSYQFVSRSIESWFDVEVEGALAAGLNLGRATLDTLAADLGNKTRQAATQIAETPDAMAGLALERLRDQLQASDVVLWSPSGQVIASAGDSRFLLKPERPSVQQLRSARTQRVVTQIEGLDEVVSAGNGELTAGASGPPANAGNAPRVKAVAVVNSPNVNVLGDARFLQVTQLLPEGLVANAVAVQEANREYQERALARGGLRKMYIGTLTLSLFLAVFGAVLLAVLLGNQLAKPLLVLAEGVRQVAQGDLTPKAALQGKDELGGLTRSFADMTQQLSDARTAVQHSMSQVDAARANLQTILDNLTAGVIVLDVRGRIQSSNPGATRILRAPLAAYHGQSLGEVPGLGVFAKDVLAQFADYLSDAAPHGLEHWQQSFELNAAMPGAPDNAITLIARGAEMPGTEEFLLVFDDISEMVSAQRAQAWGEVARRLAHEIKNPLTPIQLSAERLEMKLTGKVGEAEQQLLTKSVKTIVDQVDAMKRLVNEFRDYARLPAAELKPVDLNALVADVMQLYLHDNLSDGHGGRRSDAAAAVPVVTELDPKAPLIQGDAQQLRQVIHNLLQNAQDAQEGKEGALVTLKTEYSEASKRVRLSVRDKGTGFPEHILKRAFEPYVTTKVKGTGLGLAVVKKIADEHGARIDISNRLVDGAVQGAQVSLSFAVVA